MKPTVSMYNKDGKEVTVEPGNLQMVAEWREAGYEFAAPAEEPPKEEETPAEAPAEETPEAKEAQEEAVGEVVTEPRPAKDTKSSKSSKKKK